MYCRYCGKPLTAKGFFCGSCGKKISTSTSSAALDPEGLRLKIIGSKRFSIWLFVLLGIFTLPSGIGPIMCGLMIFLRSRQIAQLRNEPASVTKRRWELKCAGVPPYDIEAVMKEELRKQTEEKIRKQQEQEQEREKIRERARRQKEQQRSEERRRQEDRQGYRNEGTHEDMSRYFYTLSLSPNATKKEISVAYRRLAHKYHPDKGGDAKKFEEIKAAYDILMKEKH